MFKSDTVFRRNEVKKVAGSVGLEGFERRKFEFALLERGKAIKTVEDLQKRQEGILSKCRGSLEKAGRRKDFRAVQLALSSAREDSVLARAEVTSITATFGAGRLAQLKEAVDGIGQVRLKKLELARNVVLGVGAFFVIEPIYIAMMDSGLVDPRYQPAPTIDPNANLYIATGLAILGAGAILHTVKSHLTTMSAYRKTAALQKEIYSLVPKPIPERIPIWRGKTDADLLGAAPNPA